MKRKLTFFIVLFLMVLVGCNDSSSKKTESDQDTLVDVDATSDKDPVVDDNDPVVDDKDPVVDDKDPVVDDKDPVVDDEDPVVDKDEESVDDDQDEFVPADVATLKTLSLKGIDLTPAFGADVFDYAATVASEVETAELNAVATEEHAAVEIDGVKSEELEAKKVVQLKPAGENTIIKVKVTAQDTTTTKTYTITVTRPAIDLCKDVTCSGHGECRVKEGVAECVCENGYYNNSSDNLTCVTDCDVINIGELEGSESGNYKAAYTPNTGNSDKKDIFSLDLTGASDMKKEHVLDITNADDAISGDIPVRIRIYEDGYGGTQFLAAKGVVSVEEAEFNSEGKVAGKSKGVMNSVLMKELEFNDDYDLVFKANGRCLVFTGAKWNTMPQTCSSAVNESTECFQSFSPACDETSSKCVECTADSYCDGMTPACDLEKKACVACNRETEASNCTDPGYSVCGADHTCVQCRDDSTCSGDSPFCKSDSGSCVQCKSDDHCKDNSEGKNVCSPFMNRCVECTDNSHCAEGKACMPWGVCN